MADNGYGFLGAIGMGVEATWGTAATRDIFFKAMNESLVGSIERIDIDNIAGQTEEPDDYGGQKMAAGDIAFAGRPRPLGAFLYAAMGIDTVSEIEAGELFGHSFTIRSGDVSSTNPLPSYTIEVDRGVGSGFLYEGACVSKLDLEVAWNESMRATANLVAKSQGVSAKTAPAYVNSPVYPFGFETASLQINGAAAAHIERFKISIDNQLEAKGALNNSRNVNAIRRNGFVLLRFELTARFEGLGDYDLWNNETEFPMILSMTRANSFFFMVDAPRCRLDEYPPAASGREAITVAATGRCLLHAGSGESLQITMNDTVNTYA